LAICSAVSHASNWAATDGRRRPRYSGLPNLVTCERPTGILSGALLFALLLSLVCGVACNRGRGRSLEPAYVSAPQAALRDQVAAVYNKVGVVKNGERVRLAILKDGSSSASWLRRPSTINSRNLRASMRKMPCKRSALRVTTLICT